MFIQPLSSNVIYGSEDLFLSTEPQPFGQKMGNKLRRLSYNLQRSFRKKSRENVFDEDPNSLNHSCGNYDSVTTGNFDSGNSAGTATTMLTAVSHQSGSFYCQSSTSDAGRKQLSPDLHKNISIVVRVNILIFFLLGRNFFN